MPFYPSINEIKTFAERGYKEVPIILKKRIEGTDPIDILNKLENKEYHFILESGNIGRYTYIGNNPSITLSGKDNRVVIKKKGVVDQILEGDPLLVLEEKLSNFKVPRIKDMPPFLGGAVGYISYDYIRYVEKLPKIAQDDLMIPDIYFVIINKLWIYDNKEKILYYVEHLDLDYDSLSELDKSYHNKKNEMLSIWERHATVLSQQPAEKKATQQNREVNLDYDKLNKSLTKESFEAAVKRVQDYIVNGDVFQVNLSVRQSKQLRSHPFTIYEKLREINPSPYMGYLHFPELQLVSGSPELLIELNQGIIQSRPIAGTRPRGNSEAEDNKLVEELLGNEKEVAEHIMLVDLERNDLGRVSKYGTVQVNELMVIEKYSHVMHIVSNVIGEIDKGYSAFDCIKATFPGGTITGAPKIRTMEIIEELEPVRRGPYTGSMGWINFHGDLELNILIRTLLAKNGKGYIQAGAGIVIDSDPEKEYYESLNKAKALWKAVEVSEMG